MSGDVVTPADKLRTALEERGWTQDELAERTGIARVTINGYVNGRLGIGPKNGPLLADAFGLPTDHFVPRRNHVSPPSQILAAVRGLASEVADLRARLDEIERRLDRDE